MDHSALVALPTQYLFNQYFKNTPSIQENKLPFKLQLSFKKKSSFENLASTHGSANINENAIMRRVTAADVTSSSTTE
jgi:hypothetical protein